VLDTTAALEHSDSLIHVPLRTNDYRYVLAVIEQKSGQLDSATALYEDALDHDLGLYMAHVHLAEIAEAQHRWGDALAERERALATNPDDPSLLFDLGYLEGEVGQLDSSVTNLTRAAKLDPRDSRIVYYLGRVEEIAHDTADARAAYARFVSLAPSRYTPWIDDAQKRLAVLH
jgi:tetratricopeptide (TPR) repeat protein